jgi:hypothetical protein
MRVYYNPDKYAHPYWVRLTKVELDMLMQADQRIRFKLMDLVEKIRSRDGK